MSRKSLEHAPLLVHFGLWRDTPSSWAAYKSAAVSCRKATVSSKKEEPCGFFGIAYLKPNDQPHSGPTSRVWFRGKPSDHSPPRRASSASSARSRSSSKNCGDWPMKSPMAVKNLSAPMAAPFVWVGRMIEHTGNFRLRNGHGSGMIRLVLKSSPPKGGELRSGNTNPFVEQDSQDLHLAYPLSQ